MRPRRFATPTPRLAAIAALSAIAGVLLLAGPAAAAYPDACGLATQHDMARAFDLTNSTQRNSVLREPGNTAGVVHVRCDAFAWRGTKPTSPERRREGLLAGTFADYRIETWVKDPGPGSGAWLGNFVRKLDGLRAHAKAQFVEGTLPGRLLALPRLGFESVLGYQAPSGGVRKLRAFWWNRSAGTLISFNVVEDRDRPVGASLRSLASMIVPKVEEGEKIWGL